jgi:2,6-dihydroxypyridine 3-monooxygenase
LAGLGAGIVLNPATIRYFTARSDFNLKALSVAARWVRYMDQAGRMVHEHPCAYRFSSYNALYRGLLEYFEPDRYHLGQAVIGFEQDNDGVDVFLTDGRRVKADLLVCADGIRSTARRLLLPGLTPAYAGYIAWRGTVNQADLNPQTYTALGEAITYHIMPNSHLLVYPIPVVDQPFQAAPLGSHLNWLWYRNIPSGPTFDELLTDRDGTVRDISLPPGMVQERHMADLRIAAATLPSPLAEIIQATPQPFIQAIVDLEAPQMAFGRVCLMGDAAFVARPHAAAGTAKAAEDAWRLSLAMRAADGNVIAALQNWEPAQLQLGQRVLERTRKAGQRLQFENTWQSGDPLPFGLYEVGDSALPAE